MIQAQSYAIVMASLLGLAVLAAPRRGDRRTAAKHVQGGPAHLREVVL